MNDSILEHALIIAGPTASGKSAIGLQLAQESGAEIISMDSMALYRGMDIGTAKPSFEDCQRVAHHLINVLDPWESSSLAWWLERAEKAASDIIGRGKRPLFVGGTPLYLRGLLRGIFDGPPANPFIRSRLEELSGEELLDQLRKIDSATAGRLHPNDRKRLIRAIEVYELTGQPISKLQTQDDIQPFRNAPIWLNLPRDQLYERIDDRVDRMIADGLVEEVEAIAQLPYAISKEARQAVGYKELLAHLEGQIAWEETVAQIKTRSRQFAKRQLTWFRNMAWCRPLEVQGDSNPTAIATRMIDLWYRGNKSLPPLSSLNPSA